MGEIETTDPFTLMALIFLGAFFVYLGWMHRIEQKPIVKPSGRKVSPILLAPSLFVVIGAGEYGLAVTLILAFGMGGVSFLFGLATAMIIISLMIEKIMANVSSPTLSRVSYGGYQNISTPDFIYLKFGHLSSLLATILTAIAFWGILLLQFLVGGAIISALSGAPEVYSVCLMGVIVAFYTSLGGFSALYFTDLWQSVLMWLAIVISTIALFIIHGDVAAFTLAEESLSSLTSASWSVDIVIYLFFITVIAAFSGPDLWQRANMANNATEAKTSLVLAAISVVLFGIVISYFSVDIKAVLSTQTSIHEGNELKQYLALVVSSDNPLMPNELIWPEWLRIVFAIGVLSAFVSTADTSAMLVATSIQNETLRKSQGKVDADKTVTNSLVIISCISAAFASLYTSDIAEKFTAILGVLGVLGIPTFLALFGRGNSVTFFIAVVLGTIFLITQTFFFPEYNDGAYLFLPFIPGLFCLFIKSGEEYGQ